VGQDTIGCVGIAVSCSNTHEVFLLTPMTAASGLYLKALACGIDVVLETYRQKLVTVEQKVVTRKFQPFLLSMRETTCKVANQVTRNSNSMLILTSTSELTALHPLQRKQCKLSR